MFISSNPNSPVVAEVKKRGRPKTTVKPVVVEAPSQEEPQEVPEAKSEMKAKAAPAKRGRKPGKKSETGAGSSEQAGAVAPPELISEEVLGNTTRIFFCIFLNNILQGNSSPKPEPKPTAKRGRTKKVKN